ncbi:carbonic anhydrase 1 [Drosophila erecta]|uniref:carbonic anhydrase 1 n=1 Tax=Drosophila erecta TaxID=7220 RepID=UPI000732B792|nr:carbonic anhydrase 1 [Drosophila erecta]KQS51970.1 uncharacterized protein Dere_GG26558 [Drosophila erecta]
MQANAFHKMFLLLPLALFQTANGAQWNYLKQGTDWGGLCSSGKSQSPIALDRNTAYKKALPAIFFGNYYQQLTNPVWIRNNGHTITLEITKTINGRLPYISGGRLKGRYLASNLHFHWGSNNSRGAEHLIQRLRYYGEIHIVHWNEKYKNVAEAAEQKDGLAVVAVLMSIDKKRRTKSETLISLMESVVRIPIIDSNTSYHGFLSLDELIDSPNLKDFFSYDGSLTTPNCYEAVIWIVFTEITFVGLTPSSKFWLLTDDAGNQLVNNYRSLQHLNGRTVFYRVKKNRK